MSRIKEITSEEFDKSAATGAEKMFRLHNKRKHAMSWMNSSDVSHRIHAAAEIARLSDKMDQREIPMNMNLRQVNNRIDVSTYLLK